MIKMFVDSGIYLKDLQLAHAPSLFSLVENNRAFLGKWLGWVPFSKTLEDSRDFILTVQKQIELKQGFHGGIFYQGELAGVLGFHCINRTHKHASIGYWLGEEFTGQGVMTRAVQRLVTHGFADEGLNRIEIRCAIENTASAAIPIRLGFHKEGVLRQCEKIQGVFLDHAVYGVLKEEWRAAQR